MALAANGGVASSSSNFSAGTTSSGAINGDRKGLNWNNGGGWKSGAALPQWLQVQFAGQRTIDRVVLYDVQDNWTNPVEPTDTMTNSLYGSSFIDFTVSVWNGASFIVVGTVTNNTLVKRTVTFPATTTDRIRVTVTRSADAYARLAEIEAFTSEPDTTAPTMSITSPSAGSTLTGLVSVNASASDNVGVARVDFLVNGAIAASDSTAPYTFSWDSTKVANGSATLAAKAYDDAGMSATASITVTVANATVDTQVPSVSITSPSAGSTLQGTVAVSASASDNVGVKRVDLYANNVIIGSAATSPYTFSWNTATVPDGSVVLKAVAYDAADNHSNFVVNVTVANTTVAPPLTQPTLTVTSVNPAAGVAMRVYPADLSGSGDGTALLTRTYNANTRVWLSAALRSGNNYFVKWQKDGVDYGTASTTSVVVDNNHTLTAVYETPTCSGVAVYPGIDSLKNAVAGYPAGTTFCIKAGIHRMNSQVNARTNDKYIGESGAVLNGSKVLTSFAQAGSYWVASGQTQQEPPFPAASGSWPVCNASAPACIYPEMVFLDGQDLWQVTSLAELAPGRFYFDYANDRIYLADNPTGRLVEATTGSGGLIWNSDGASDSVTVKNLVFEKFGGGQVSLYAHNAIKAGTGWRVENNEFRFISFMAVANFGKGVVRNNYIHHNGRLGIVGNGTIEGNVISYTNTHGWEPGTDAGPMKFHGTNGLVLRGNIVANNTGKGIWVDFDNINVTYENNVVENNSLMGILHEVSCTATIRYNVLRGNNSANSGQQLSRGAQIFARGSMNLDIYGNDVTATSPGVHGIGVWGDFLSTGQPKTYSGTNCGTLLSQNIQVHDNVVRLDVGQLSGNPWGGIPSNIFFSNNTYYLKDLTGPHFHYNGGPWTKEQYQAAGGDVNGKFYQY